MRRDTPYDVTEYLLAGLLVADIAVALLWTSACWMEGDWFGVAEGSGIALMLAGGLAHPKQYLLDCAAVLRIGLPRSGRETALSVAAGWLGFALAMLGWLGGWWLDSA